MFNLCISCVLKCVYDAQKDEHNLSQTVDAICSGGYINIIKF